MGKKIGWLVISVIFTALIVKCIVPKESAKVRGKQFIHLQEDESKRALPIMSVEFLEGCKRYAKIKNYMKEMTLEEKIGQLFFVTVQQARESDAVGRMVGGVILFKQDITTKDETISLTEGLQEKAITPLWIGVDEEGGRVSRVGINKAIVNQPFMKAKEIGKTKDTQVAYEEARRMGGILSSLGINMNFAPDADVFNNPNNTVIGDRSFGTTKEDVVPMVIAFSKGLQDSGVVSVVKHFPGHGNTVQDSHKGLAYIEKSVKELEQEELVPFFEATKNGGGMIMVGHLVVPEMDGLPATLSPKWGNYITAKFNRKEVLFITDAMNMGAIVGSGEGKEAALQSFLSGMDIILMPEQLEEVMEDFKEAYESGVLTKERLEASVEKILLKKAEQNLLVLE